MDVKIESTWKQALAHEFCSAVFRAKSKRDDGVKKTAGKNLYPRGSLIFNAFDTTPLPQVKVVILGKTRIINRIRRWGCHFPCRMGGDSAILAQCVQGVGTDDGRLCDSESRRFDALGAAGRIFAQCGADRGAKVEPQAMRVWVGKTSPMR